MVLQKMLVASLTGMAGIAAAMPVPASAVPPTAADDTRAIATEAYVYGFPLVDNYRILHAYAVDKTSPEYKGAFNQVHNTARVYTPDDKAVQTPNSDTPYSSVIMDLRAEPIVLTLPAIEKGRYYSVQLIDLYTQNFDYLGTRATGNQGGTFLVAGPGWKGETPKGVQKVCRCETELMLALYRTQLLGPDDLDNVKKIQAGYKAQPLSAFLGTKAPPAAPAIDFMKPISAKEERSSPAFFELLDFTLRFCPAVPSETALRERFQGIGIGAGKPFDAKGLSPEMQAALKGGMEDGQERIKALQAKTADASGLFGTREFLKNDYVKRALGAQDGIYGNSKEEAFYSLQRTDAAGVPLDGASGSYRLHFAAGQLPPVNAFWSVTMYEMPQSLLVANPIHRYLVNSAMLPSLKKDADGGLTIWIQHASPGPERESNWLPAPNGPFIPVLRAYLPKPEVLSGAWKMPNVEKVPRQ